MIPASALHGEPGTKLSDVLERAEGLSPRAREDLLSAVRRYESGEWDRRRLQAELVRSSADAEIAEGPTKRPFPTAPASVLLFAKEHAIGQEDMSPEVKDGREPYMRWYRPIEERFARCMELLRKMAGIYKATRDERDRRRGQGLVRLCDEMHRYYREQQQYGDLPWLPLYARGEAERTILEQWKWFRAAMIPPRPAPRVEPPTRSTRDEWAPAEALL